MRMRGWGAAASLLLLALTLGAAPAQAQDSERLPIGKSYSWGAEQAPVTIVAFSDFQCPFCTRASATLREVLASYEGQVRVVFKHNPLPFHKDAFPASEAALAAGAQGKFLELHDLLFQNQRALDRQSLEIYGAQLGLNMVLFREALDQGRYAEEIKQDMALAQEVGARGTPTFFINGRRLAGAQPLEKFKEVIDAELADLKVAPQRGYAARVQANYAAPEAPRRPADTPAAPAPLAVVPVGKSPVRGPAKTALVTIVEFGDFECPFCVRVQPTLAALQAKYPDKVRLVFKNNPLTFHANARLAAVAALAAGEQGRFWEMHDKLYENSKALQYADLIDYAEIVGIKDMKRFKAALDHPERYEARIKADQALAEKVDARGTPTFFVNGRRLVGAQPLSTFEEAVEAALKEAEPLVAKRLRGEPLYAALQKEAARTIAAKEAAPAERVEVKIGAAPTWGDAKAPVTIVVFSDFQCPFCSRGLLALEALKKRYGAKKLRLVFKHMPLPFHTDARPAAAAAIAAGNQGKFWELHDLLFQNQRALTAEDLAGYGAQLGLDMERFRRDMDSPATAALIDADIQEAKRVGANGTPTFFINGRLLSGAQPEAAFVTIIDEELKKKR